MNDNVLNLSALARELRQFAQERDWEQFHSPKNLSMAMSVEVAELLEHFQWLTEEQSMDLAPAELAEVSEEIADIQIYLTRLACRLVSRIAFSVCDEPRQATAIRPWFRKRKIYDAGRCYSGHRTSYGRDNCTL